MRFEELYPVLDRNGLSVFSPGILRTLFPKEQDTNMVKSLQRWKGKGYVVQLKKGLYELAYPGDRHIPGLYIANHLYAPSYVSLETAMSAYSLIPEVSQAVTSITTKTTRKFRTRHGLFIYRTLQPALFNGYQIGDEAGYKVLMAEPEKALADYIYFRNFRKKKIDLEGERIDWKSVRKLDRSRIAGYFRIFGMKVEALNAYL